MKANTSLLTSAAENSVNASIDAYLSAVAAHVSRDWGAHNQMQLYNVLFSEPSTGHTMADSNLLRLQLTGINNDGTGEAIFALPVINLSAADPAIVDIGSAPMILQQPISLTVNIGESATFTVVAASATEMTYAWKRDNVLITGANAASYTVPNAQLTDEAAYTVVVSNEYGSVTSTAATLNVGSILLITQQPVNQMAYAGQTVTFSVTVTGPGPITYVWWRNEDSIASFLSYTAWHKNFPVTGIGGPILTIPNVQALTDQAAYFCVVSNPYGSTTSAKAWLSVQAVQPGAGFSRPITIPQ